MLARWLALGMTLLLAMPANAQSASHRRFQALKASGDGGALAYIAITPDFGPRSVEVQSGATPSLKLPGRITGRHSGTPSPRRDGKQGELAWSPDGRWLAYLAEDHGQQLRLWLWNRETGGAEPVPGAVACGDPDLGRIPDCFYNSLAWAPDGRTVYFLGNAAGKIADTAPSYAGRGDPVPASATMAGVQVFVSAPRREASPTPRRKYPAELFAYTLGEPGARPLTTGGYLTDLLLSPDGRTAALVENTPGSLEWKAGDPKQDYLDYFLLAVDAAEPRRLRSPGGLAPKLARIRQRYAVASWSPDSRHLALIEHGAAADGDVLLFARDTEVTRSLAANWHPRDGAAEIQLLARDAVFPGRKFGGAIHAPAWSADGRALLVERRAPLGGGWRTSLWRIGIDGGTAALLIGNPGCDVEAAFSTGREELALSYCGSGKLRLARIDGTTVRESGVETFLDRPSLPTLGRSGTLLFASPSPDHGDEAYSLDYRDRRAKALTRVNAALQSDALDATTIWWRGAGGNPLWGTVYRAHGQKTPGPVIVSIYPRDPYVIRLPAGSNLFLDDLVPEGVRRLIPRDYSIFVPWLPIAGGGKSCATLADDLDRGLDAIASRRLADTSRAGLVGMSFGGWAVNCIVGRSTRFAAAVSIAGLSDLVSQHFDGGNRVLARGGGQVNIVAPLEKAPGAYWRESPVSRLDQIETPLLLVHGKADMTHSYLQAVELFNGLRDRGKSAELALYEALDHRSVFFDPRVNDRIARWFACHLRNENCAR